MEANEPLKTLDVAIFGFGGRAQDVLKECVQLQEETGKRIRVVAICDDHSQESYDFYVKNRLPVELTTEYAHIFESTRMYSDTEEGICALLHDHPHVDKIFITSANNRHAAHLQAVLDHSSCQSLYLEKPLFRTLEEWSQFNRNLGDRNIQVGLTLRSAKITSLAAEHLKAHQSALGKLKKVHSWEHVNFGHGLTIIMMNWRRYISLSGGLLIEKSVHDLDLACFFMEAVDVHPQSMHLTTHAAHNFYTKAHQQQITDTLLHSATVRASAEGWDRIPWQRAICFSYDIQGKIDWKQTMGHFFAAFPEDDALQDSDIIPDTHTVHAEIQTTSGDTVDFDLDLKLNGFATQTERGCRLKFEHGEVEIDMENSKMVIQLPDQMPLTLDLNMRGVPHAGGDVYVAHGILGTLPTGRKVAQFSDPSVQISSVMGLVSEYQALHHIKDPMYIEMVDGRWKIPTVFQGEKVW